MKKLLCGILCLTLLFGVMSGCAKNEKIPESDEITLNNFESYKDLNTPKYLNYFGKISLNSDKKFIKGGDFSSKLEIYGAPNADFVYEYFQIYEPYIKFYADNWMFNKTDISDVESFIFDAYNDCEYDLEVRFAIKGSTIKLDETYYLPSQTLKAKSWNKLDFVFDRAAYSIDFDLTKTLEFCLIFENREKEESPCHTVYIDNFRYKKAKTVAEPLTRKSGDIINSFEDDFDFKSVRMIANACEYKAGPEIQTCVDTKYITDGRKSIKVSYTASKVKHFFYEGWVGFGIMPERWDTPLSYDSSVKEISVKIFNDCDFGINVVATVETMSGAAPAIESTILKSKSWNTVVVPMKEHILSDTYIGTIKTITYTTAQRFDVDTLLYVDDLKFVKK